MVGVNVSVNLFDFDRKRLNELSEKLNHSKSGIIRVAVKQFHKKMLEEICEKMEISRNSAIRFAVKCFYEKFISFHYILRDHKRLKS